MSCANTIEPTLTPERIEKENAMNSTQPASDPVLAANELDKINAYWIGVVRLPHQPAPAH